MKRGQNIFGPQKSGHVVSRIYLPTHVCGRVLTKALETLIECLFFIFRAVEALVNYAYNGRVQLDINNVQSILVGANFLQLGVVKEACCEFLKNR